MESIKNERIIAQRLFFITAAFFLIWLIPQGSMIAGMGDATDIWKTITTFYDADRYPSYVLYKGFLSVYPYVWFYRIALLLHVNDFLFIMVYHAVLFSYIAVIGLPNLIRCFTKYEPRLWQRIVLIILLFVFWKSTNALGYLMVDLPSCAIFIGSMNCAVGIERQRGRKRWLFVGLTGLLCGLGTTISGQYSVAMTFVMLYAIIKCFINKDSDIKRSLRYKLGELALMLILFYLPFVGNAVFDYLIIEPIRLKQGYFAMGETWLKRGLIFMMRNNRLFSGPGLTCLRGHAVLWDLYGSEETAMEIWQIAADGGFGWTIKDWFYVFFHYPIDILCMMFDKAFIAISHDFGRNSLCGLVVSYTSLFISLYQLSNIKKVRDILQPKTLLLLGWITTIAPLLVLSVEMRCALSIHALIFGMAVLSPTLPAFGKSFLAGVKRIVKEKSLIFLGEKKFPWTVVMCLMFVAFCVAHMGDLYAQSDLGLGTLFNWF